MPSLQSMITMAAVRESLNTEHKQQRRVSSKKSITEIETQLSNQTEKETTLNIEDITSETDLKLHIKALKEKLSTLSQAYTDLELENKKLNIKLQSAKQKRKVDICQDEIDLGMDLAEEKHLKSISQICEKLELA